MTRKRRAALGPRPVRILTLSFLMMASSALALAQTPTTARFSTARFKPAISPLNFIVTESGETLPHLSPSVALMFNYAHRVLAFGDTDLIRHRWNMDVMIGFGLWDRIELGIGLPVTLGQDTGDSGLELSGGLGDMRIVPKGRLFTVGPLTLAISVPIELPTGSQDNYLGNSGVSIMPNAIADVVLGPVGMALNVGYRLRTDDGEFQITPEQSLIIGDEFVTSAAVGLEIVPDLVEVMVDGQFAMGVRQQSAEELYGELHGAVRVHLPADFDLTVGGGPGIGSGVGVPALRVFAGLAYHMAPERDSDGDGIPDETDACPKVAEDKDGFEDADGCPEEDNDRDGILDAADRCPNEPEDKDGFEDEDGCPDTDNDGDGVLDIDDRCPNDAEDKDGFEDEDGCPDADNDADGFSDAKDACPNEAETKNDFKDDDGCPDEPPAMLKKFTGKIPEITFQLNKAVIRKSSHPTLNEAIKVLGEFATMKVLIRGHTDNTGTAQRNAVLAGERAKAVKSYLVKGGIAANRLTTEGVGPREPIADNSTDAGRAQNRRVQFVVTE